MGSLQKILTAVIGVVIIGAIMGGYLFVALLLPNIWQDADKAFVWKRLLEESSFFAYLAPVGFAFGVVGLIVWFREERKLLAAIVGLVVVGTVSFVYLIGALLLRVIPNVSWLVVLMPVMAVALFYVGMMYLRDAKSVHWLWAIFLGLLRTSVYLILSIVFLLPGCQHSETQEFESKVIVLFDVSDSMFVRDDLPEIGQDPATLPARQDKIVKFLLGKEDVDGKRKDPFVERVLQKTPLTCYRFGGILDETEILTSTRTRRSRKP